MENILATCVSLGLNTPYPNNDSDDTNKLLENIEVIDSDDANKLRIVLVFVNVLYILYPYLRN